MPRPTSPDSREMVRATVTVHGRVQGVYFRAFLKEQARTAGANGFVRNLTNGRVEAIFEGPRVVVDTMVGWCKHGSPASEVTRVDIDWGTPQGLSGFDIRY